MLLECRVGWHHPTDKGSDTSGLLWMGSRAVTGHTIWLLARPNGHIYTVHTCPSGTPYKHTNAKIFK